MRHRAVALLVLSFGYASLGYAQLAGNQERKPNLPPKVDAQWVKAEKAVTAAREKYLKEVQKAIDDFAKQVAKLDPQADGKELCDKFKAVVLPDAPEVAVPVFGPGVLAGPDNHRYKLFEDNLSWEDAKKKCEEEGGHLLVIDSAQEKQFIRQSLAPVLKQGNDQLWMGATKNDKGAWFWLTGQPMANVGWEAHFPVPDGGKDFLVMNGNGLYINERGNNRPGMRFICEWDR